MLRSCISTKTVFVAFENSRTLRLGAEVSGESEATLLGGLNAFRVSVGVDNHPDCVATAEILVDTLRRLPIQLEIDHQNVSSDAAAFLISRAASINPRLGIRTETGSGAFSVYVGRGGHAPQLRGVPSRHGAHLSVGDEALPVPAPASALGHMTCAALLAGEVFKSAAHVLPGRRIDHQRLSWCPVTLSTDPDSCDPVPQDDLELALVGLGAVGTATARILAALPFGGSVLLVDPERFAPENLETYSIGNEEAARSEPWKTDLVASAFTRMEASVFRGPVERLVEAIDRGDARWPRITLSGLDSATARRETQRLWPDRLIDGATGGTMCGLHDVEFARGGACLMCLFPRRTEGPSSTERLASLTGLPPEVLRYGDQPLTEKHLSALAPEKAASLRPLVGKPVCGLAEAVGLTALPVDDYQPAVPFVSQQAACLVVGRLVADLLGISRRPRFVQYDCLIGPQAATMETRPPSRDCFCQQRARIVDQVRADRGASRTSLGRPG